MLGMGLRHIISYIKLFTDSIYNNFMIISDKNKEKNKRINQKL